MDDLTPWPPVRYSEPLTPDFPSLFGKYREVFRIAWRTAMGYSLDEWQEDLLCHITELKPDGRLRWRQYLVSLGRQNGKTEIAAALGLLFILAFSAPYVIGIATSAEQARLVYDRAMRVITRNPALSRQFDALTDTRGIRATDGGKWEIKASKSAALQGLPIGLGIVDEVHLVKLPLWLDLVAGLGGRPDAMVAGITTAGDDESELLKHLYDLAESGESSTFGFSIWEAPESRVPEDDETLLEYLKAANPALAAGRLDPEVVLADVRAQPEDHVIRYRLNRFVSSSNAFISPDAWQACLSDPFTRPSGARPVFAFDRTPDWSWATVAAAYKDAEGIIWTEVVASLRNPSIEDLANLATTLLDHNPAGFAVDGYSLRPLAEELRGRGFQNVKAMSQADIVSASALVWGKIRHRRIRHAGDQLLTVQVPRAVRKNVGESWRISRDASTAQIDALMSTVIAAYVADTTTTDAVHQIF